MNITLQGDIEVAQNKSGLIVNQILGVKLKELILDGFSNIDHDNITITIDGCHAQIVFEINEATEVAALLNQCCSNYLQAKNLQRINDQ